MTTCRRRLFVSYVGLLRALYQRRVPSHLLTNALFYFDCTRTHVFEVGVGGERGELPAEYARNKEGVEQVYNTVLAALQKAELEERVLWRDEEASWEQLNTLLNANEYPPLNWHAEMPVCFSPEVAVLAAEATGHALCVFDR